MCVQPADGLAPGGLQSLLSATRLLLQGAIVWQARPSAMALRSTQSSACALWRSARFVPWRSPSAALPQNSESPRHRPVAPRSITACRVPTGPQPPAPQTAAGPHSPAKPRAMGSAQGAVKTRVVRLDDGAWDLQVGCLHCLESETPEWAAWLCAPCAACNARCAYTGSP